MTRERKYTISYSLVQASFWMSLCVFLGFAAVYLQYLGYSNARLGIIMAIGTLLGSLLGPELSSLIDVSTNDRISASGLMTPVIVIEAVATIVLLLFSVDGLLTSVTFIIYIAVTTSINSLILKLYTDSSYCGMGIDYGISRSMGSLGYVAASVVVGALCESISARAVPAAGLAISIFQYASFRWFSTYLKAAQAEASYSSSGASIGNLTEETYANTSANSGAQNADTYIIESESTGDQAEETYANTRANSDEQTRNRKARAKRGGIAAFLMRNKRFCLILAGTVLIFYAHNTLCNFFINVVRNVGGDTGEMGLLNGLMALVEIPVIFFYTKLTGRFRTSSVLRLGFIMFTAKAAAIAAAQSVGGLASAMILQAPSFGLYTGAIVLYTDLMIAHEDSAKAQSLAFSVTMLGSVFASTVSGHMFDIMPVSPVMWIACAVSAIGSILAVIGVADTGKKQGSVH